MNVVTNIRQFDGPLVERSTEATVKLMAAVLVEQSAFHNEAESMRALQGFFPMVEIIVHGDNARQYAMQTVVAREMSRP